MIDKNIIKTRKAIYGNNFPEIAKLQNEHNKNKFYNSIKNKNFIIRYISIFFYNLFYIELKPCDVAKNLSILKQVRINFTRRKLQELRNVSNFNDYIVQIKIKDLNNGLEDSKKDYSNYLWIAENYEEYESL